MKDYEITQYLNRVSLDDCNNDLEGLIKLQEHHIENVPFENLDVIIGRDIELEYDHLFHKIIQNRRGGYCFELNLLFAALLRSLGFSPRPVLGRVWLRNPEQIPPRNHLAHLLELDGKTYITDIGFGGTTTRIPLNIHAPEAVEDKDGWVRIIPWGVHQFMIQRKHEEAWANQYSFETVDIGFQDIEISNFFTSKSSKSHFLHNRFIGRFTNDGRVGLSNNQLSIRKGLNVINEKEIPYGEEWLTTIKNQFDLDLDFSEQELAVLFRE